ncbi:hypothetical protein SAMN05216249_107127 [Acetitomaculum ruminis DSM 5522]|uniref:Uncharacterized protein n=1 Tax=Acetitomaculum ruminis DSM 5522 TaxID=1120918 RepID=A0A1I0XU61_9FIRM|nr:ATP-binding protein [Acetitomaculum ruminis]SFB03976.1 hypothetical protein SAMN05216249_107127 [Acetitomaculum ruminis DSM 5522]
MLDNKLNIQSLILYKNLKYGDIINNILNISYREINEENKCLLYNCLGNLVQIACEHGLKGNLWHLLITASLVENENSFSLEAEHRESVNGSIVVIAKYDFELLYQVFNTKVEELFRKYGIKKDLITDFENTNTDRISYNDKISKEINKLAKKLSDAENSRDFMKEVMEFYRKYGVGRFGLHKAFRVVNKDEKVSIVAINNVKKVELSDLIGYESAKKKLIDNTEAFIKGKNANNCLLFGAAGTGKSSSIKAILNKYFEDGLRIIEIYKYQFKDLLEIISQIKNRNYRFIIYMDDLSFEEFETEYKYLKAVIEGGLEKKPENVIIYATSNRRHLIREKFSDKSEKDDDLHSNDTIAEKLSLASRFGVSIYFDKPDKTEFNNIVIELAKKSNIKIDENELILKANKWELSHGGMSGRCARQFIDYLSYELEMDSKNE